LWARGITKVEKGMNSHKLKLGGVYWAQTAHNNCFQTLPFKLPVVASAVYVLEDCIMAFIMCLLFEKWAEYPHCIPELLFVHAIKGNGRVKA
jgi:hypothetical protein